ncbi:sulfotransferase [Hyphobacterium sp. CCMP332]|nr:sulfotransferase [Hyphobacterium sp. CCMP332]
MPIINVLYRVRLLKKCSAFIIGAQKSGTTELFETLKDHPQIITSFNKEVHFFSSEHKYLNQGVSWYYKQFPKISFWSSKILLEATPSYLFFPKALERLKKYNPNAKIIVLLRNPVKRAYSAWNMFSNLYKDEGREKKLLETRPFEVAIDNELNKVQDTMNIHFYLDKGIYINQILNLFKIFDRDQILILESEKYWQNKKKFNLLICEFLDVTPFDFVEKNKKQKAKGSYQYEISKETHKKLIDFYSPYNKRLSELIGEDFNW